MDPIRLLRALVVVALSLACAAAPSGFGEQERSDGGAVAPPIVEFPAVERPNVVVVVIDDMAWEDLYFVPTPNMSRLIQRGRLYTNFYGHPVCSPSRVGLLFGLQGSRLGITSAIDLASRSDIGVPVDEVSIGTSLHVAGYATALFGKWHVSSDEAGMRELARVFGFEAWHAGHRSTLGTDGRGSQYGWPRLDDSILTTDPRYASESVAAAFADWWHSPDERPRFAVVSLFTPHEPFSPPPAELLPEGESVPTADQPERVRFESAVMALDTIVGRVAETVDLSNTLLFVLPDNGTPFSAKPPSKWYKGYKLTCWQGGVHMPMFVLGPGVARGTSDHLTHIIDLPRTILEECGAPPSFGYTDSRSFRASLSGAQEPREPIFLQYENELRVPVMHPSCWAVVDSDGYKLIESGNTLQLFHLPTDPRERTPVLDRERITALESVAKEFLE
ncbi:MAG: sulfatase-like hydrolase/transferase [Planctomycetota bacterium]